MRIACESERLDGRIETKDAYLGDKRSGGKTGAAAQARSRLSWRFRRLTMAAPGASSCAASPLQEEASEEHSQEDHQRGRRRRRGQCRLSWSFPDKGILGSCESERSVVQQVSHSDCNRRGDVRWLGLRSSLTFQTVSSRHLITADDLVAGRPVSWNVVRYATGSRRSRTVELSTRRHSFGGALPATGGRALR